MPIADLLRDDRLLPAALKGELRDVTRDFILRRVRALVDLNPGDPSPTRPGDIAGAATTAIRDLLLAELPRVTASEEAAALQRVEEREDRVHRGGAASATLELRRRGSRAHSPARPAPRPGGPRPT
jgi:hypothetical protein